MKRIACLLCVSLFMLGFLTCCAPARVQCFLARGIYSAAGIDSLLSVHSLPALSEWEGAAQFTDSGVRIPQWRHVERFKGSDTLELVYVVEARESSYLYVCRAVLRRSH